MAVRAELDMGRVRSRTRGLNQRAEASPAAGEVGYIEDGLLDLALLPLMRAFPPLWEYLVANGSRLPSLRAG